MNTELYLVRHGQPIISNALLGSTDSPLDELGWKQLEIALDSIGSFDLIVSSPLSRCANFAQQTASEINKPLVIEPDWQECHFGDWDGIAMNQLHQKFPKELSQFFSSPATFSPPNAETLKDFSMRVENTLLNLLKAHQGKKIIVFTHAGVIRTLVAWCLNIDYLSGLQFRRFSIDYGSVTHLSIYHDGQIFPQLRSLNRQANLATEETT